MTEVFEHILQQAKSLSRTEQFALIDSIEDTLSLSEEVAAENRQRLARYDTGVVQAIPLLVALTAVRHQLMAD